ncbi:hypothetical protein NC651_011440 [Populus alba x Populus x berolinensis]|nr:hypothetical protein NC651_011440 [Populus alba x Populus x berolinensis]
MSFGCVLFRLFNIGSSLVETTKIRRYMLPLHDGVGESDNCHINVEIISVVHKMACFGTWICATDIGWWLDVEGFIL